MSGTNLVQTDSEWFKHVGQSVLRMAIDGTYLQTVDWQWSVWDRPQQFADQLFSTREPEHFAYTQSLGKLIE